MPIAFHQDCKPGAHAPATHDNYLHLKKVLSVLATVLPGLRARCSLTRLAGLFNRCVVPVLSRNRRAADPHAASSVLQHVGEGAAQVEFAKLLLVVNSHDYHLSTGLAGHIYDGSPRAACLDDRSIYLQLQFASNRLR